MAHIPGEALTLEQDRELTSDILELHLFNDTTEYRAVLSQANLIDGVPHYIEAIVADDTQDYAEKIAEECFLLPEYRDEKLGVMNYMQFDESDLLHLVNYRLYEVKGGRSNG